MPIGGRHGRGRKVELAKAASAGKSLLTMWGKSDAMDLVSASPNPAPPAASGESADEAAAIPSAEAETADMAEAAPAQPSPVHQAVHPQARYLVVG